MESRNESWKYADLIIFILTNGFYKNNLFKYIRPNITFYGEGITENDGKIRGLYLSDGKVIYHYSSFNGKQSEECRIMPDCYCCCSSVYLRTPISEWDSKPVDGKYPDFSDSILDIFYTKLTGGKVSKKHIENYNKKRQDIF